MKLYYDKRLKDPTYYAQQGYRDENKKSTTRNVKNFGKHSELLKITDDPLAYVKEEIRKMNEEYNQGKAVVSIALDFNASVGEGGPRASASRALNIGYFLLQYMMKDLRLGKFFDKQTRDRKISFDCYTIARFLTYARILDPKSKHATWDRLDTYFEQPSFDYQHILRFMDILEENSRDYLKWLYQESEKIVKRDSSVVYYDCTNYYFECEREDEDYIDTETGEIIEGLRRYGVSKEHRPNPIVEMGLLMDKRGIPITMCLHPGNKSEQLTAIPLEKDILEMTNGSKLIYCADAGLGSYHIRQFNSMGGRAFIVTQSLKKLSDVMKTAVFNDQDYHLLSSGAAIKVETLKTLNRDDDQFEELAGETAFKVIDAEHAVDLGLYEEIICENGKTKRVKATGTLKQRLIVTFSRKAMEYQRAVRRRQVERARKLLETCDPDQIKKGPHDVRRFLKRSAKGKGGEEAKVKFILDEDRIAEEERYDGYYAIATNLEDPAKDIIAIAEKRYLIEDCFRIMKTNFSGRPVYHRENRRIKAHFLICYTALLVYRLLECKLDDQGTHITTDELIETLKNMNVHNLLYVSYESLYGPSTTLNALTKLTGLGLDKDRYQPKVLKRKLKSLL